MNRWHYATIESLGPPLLIGILLSLWIVTRFFSDEQDSKTNEHLASPRGGQIISLAENRYHLELIVDQEGILRLYMLGENLSQILEVEQQNLTSYVKPEGSLAAIKVPLVATPQIGDGQGRTSCFVGKLPPELHRDRLYATIPNLRIEGNRYHANFAPQDHAIAMPRGVPTKEAERLYLTPAGKYSSEDIQRNGRLTASQKYARFEPRHDPRPKPGDPLCPVTQTKANPECTWIINGEPYQFCCPPCIDEYVRLAKDQPHRLQPPAAFSQQTKHPSL